MSMKSSYYQSRYRARLREKGYVKREIWIPPEYTKILKDCETALRVGILPIVSKSAPKYAPESEMSEDGNWTTKTLHRALAESEAADEDVIRIGFGYTGSDGSNTRFRYQLNTDPSPRIDLLEVINKLGDRLYGVHLKDFAEQKKSTHGVILGKGHLDVAGVFKALKKVGFPANGALSLEYEENVANPIPDIQECLAVAAAGAQKALKG